MSIQIPEWVKPGVWGGVIGAAAIAFIGFNAGWVVTSGTAQERADRQTEKALIASLTPICVAQFKGKAKLDQTTHLAALQKVDSWKRGDYVEKQGWATTAASEKPNDEVAEACATEIMKLTATKN